MLILGTPVLSKLSTLETCSTTTPKSMRTFDAEEDLGGTLHSGSDIDYDGVVLLASVGWIDQTDT